MPKYMLLLYRGEPSPEEREERESEKPLWIEFNRSLRDAGLLVSGEPLYPVEAATTVRVRNEETEILDGPFAVTKEFLAGYFLLERAGILATLIRHVGDFQLAEDAVQDAFAAAVATWPRDGIPSNPGAWITTAARRRAIDWLRRTRSLADRTDRLAELVRLDLQEHRSVTEDSLVADDRLRLIFTCCHPALAMPARVALTLRTLGGLSTAEVARAFVVSEPAMGKRIVRAKGKIADAHIPYRVPSDDELPDRLGGVLRVVYLIFSEGYSAGEGDRLVRG